MSEVPGLSPFDSRWLPSYQEATAAARVVGWAYYAPYLLSKNRPQSQAVLVDQDQDALCLYQWQMRGGSPHLDVLFPPLPMHDGVLLRALERCGDYNREHTARVMRIDERDAREVERVTGLEVQPRRQQYLFAAETYDDLSGKSMRTLRRQLARFDSRTGVEVRAFQPSDADACRNLLRRWKREHRRAHGTAGGTSSTRTAIDLAARDEPCGLEGEIILLGGDLVAFAFGGLIRPGLVCFFDAKSDATIEGLAYAQRLHFLRRFEAGTRINDGSDAGRPGLKQLKDSFRPVGLHVESRARPRRRRINRR